MIYHWQVNSSSMDKSCRIFNIRKDRATSPRTGKCHEFYVLESDPWVNVIPITPSHQVVLIRQYRHGTREVTLEIPGGLVEKTDTPEQAALRELKEETGYQGDDICLIGQVHPNPAFLDNSCYTYLVRGVNPTSKQNLDDKEDIEVILSPLENIPEMIRDGTINHSLVLSAFFFFFLKFYPSLLG